jgi:hypothetical protein
MSKTTLPRDALFWPRGERAGKKINKQDDVTDENREGNKSRWSARQ